MIIYGVTSVRTWFSSSQNLITAFSHVLTGRRQTYCSGRARVSKLYTCLKYLLAFHRLNMIFIHIKYSIIRQPLTEFCLFHGLDDQKLRPHRNEIHFLKKKNKAHSNSNSSIHLTVLNLNFPVLNKNFFLKNTLS